MDDTQKAMAALGTMTPEQLKLILAAASKPDAVSTEVWVLHVVVVV